MKVALVHDYLNQFGGAERVLSALHELYPEAPIYTALYDERVMGKYFQDAQIFSPNWSKWPGLGRLYKFFSLFYPLVFESFDLSSFDVVISSSSNFAKGVITNQYQLHISYCHTPPRFLYRYFTETNLRESRFLAPLLSIVDNYLRLWDFWAAQRVDYFIANSDEVKGRIKKFYNKDSQVIYPPVELPKFQTVKVTPLEKESSQKGYFLVVSRLSAYKNVDLAILACQKLNLPLVIVGRGREEDKLRKMITDNSLIRMAVEIDDQQLADLYQNCQAVICPVADEDFGIVPVEAMLFGKPVIALRSGGYKESVVENRTGVFFNAPTVESLIVALENWQSQKMSDKFNGQEIKEWATRFSKERFKNEIQSFLEEKWNIKIKNKRSGTSISSQGE